MVSPTAAVPPTSPPPSEMISLGLSRITRLLQALRSPHTTVPIVHIAGTNGKGSVSAYLASILHTAELRVGRFNSPHLVDEWDCVRLQENVVDEEVFRKAKEGVEAVNQRETLEATPFEILTATAFSLFAQAELDVAVVEVGMGGEGDATNVVPASKTLLSILTAVDLDHQGFLGNSVGAIAKVKSGIVRESGDLVVSKQAYPEVIEVAKSVSDSRNAKVWQVGSGLFTDSGSTTSSEPDAYSAPRASLPLSPVSVFPPSASIPPPSREFLDVKLPLPGSYQLNNAATATLAAKLLRSLSRTTQLVPRLAAISDNAMRNGIESTRWDGRLQWIEWTPPSPTTSKSTDSKPSSPRRLLLDGAHNPSSARLLASYLSSLSPSDRPSTLIFGLSAPRAPSDVLSPLLDSSTGIKKVICVEFSPPVGMPWVRATHSDELARSIEEMGLDGITVDQYADVERALEKGSEVNESIVVAGSLYLVADTLRMVRRGSQQ